MQWWHALYIYNYVYKYIYIHIYIIKATVHKRFLKCNIFIHIYIQYNISHYHKVLPVYNKYIHAKINQSSIIVPYSLAMFIGKNIEAFPGFQNQISDSFMNRSI